MKKVVFLIAALAGLSFPVLAQSQHVSIVQTTDMFGVAEYSIMGKEEYDKLLKEIKEEVAVFPAAVAEAKKEWAADKEKKGAFPTSKVKARSVKKSPQDFTDESKAQLKKEKLEDREAEKTTKLAEEEENKLKRMKDGPQKDKYVEETQRQKETTETAIRMVMKVMGDKLGRPVPSNGFASLDTGAKGEAVKKAAAEKEKKATEKKAVEKKAAK
jgi:hypothetical protein